MRHPRHPITCTTTLAVTFGAIFTGNAVMAALLEEVIVTAQKREQSVNEVPITITALSAEMVTNLGVRTMEDMAMTTPGLVVNATAATGTSSWSIRGVGFQDYSTAASSTVGIYFDEIAFPYPAMVTGQFFDIGRIEVLKGPQGDLYGRNTTAGQVSFHSARPTDEFEAGFTAGIANYSQYELEGYASGALSDTARARVAFKTVQRQDGWQESLSRPGDKLGEVETYSIRALLDWDVSEDFAASFNVHYNDDQSDGIATTPVDGRLIGLNQVENSLSPHTGLTYDDLTIYSVDDNEKADWTNGPGGALRPQRDNQQYGASIKLVWNTGDLEITSVTGLEKFEREEANDWDGSALLDSSNINVTDIEVFSQELRASSQWGDDISWIAGLYYAADEIDEDYNYFFGEGFFGVNQLDTNYKVETDTMAAYIHAEWDINEQWGFTVGARYTEDERDFEGCTNDATPPDLDVPGVPLHDFLAGVLPPFVPQIEPNTCGVPDLATFVPPFTGPFIPETLEADISADEWMWKVGVDFTPNSDVLTYFNISRGFKSGGFNGANLNTVQQLGPYDLEELLSYESGFKATLLEETMQLNGAVFYYDYTDKQERGRAVTPVGIISGLTNIPESEIVGAELQLQWYPTGRLAIDISASYLDSKIKKYDAVQAESELTNLVTRDASGLELANAPEFSYNITTSYEFSIGKNLVLKPALDYLYRDSVEGAPFTPQQARESYFLLNVRLGLYSNANQKWQLTAWSRNVADEDYYASAFTGGNVWYVRSNGMPRTFGLTLDYKI